MGNDSYTVIMSVLELNIYEVTKGFYNSASLVSVLCLQ